MALSPRVRQVNSPYLGINLDITHFSTDLYSQVEMCIPYATHTHIRDSFDGHPDEPLDLDRVFQAFARAGYCGYMSAEYERPEDPMTGVPKLVEKIKTLCRKYSDA